MLVSDISYMFNCLNQMKVALLHSERLSRGPQKHQANSLPTTPLKLSRAFDWPDNVHRGMPAIALSQTNCQSLESVKKRKTTHNQECFGFFKLSKG